MNKKEIESKIDEIIKDIFCLDEIDEYNPNMSLIDDFEVDSLDAVDILIQLEREFDISISDDDININCTIQDIYDYIISKVD